MYYVYSIQSEVNPNHYYIGITINVERRLTEHNAGKSTHTNKFKPWKLISYIAFTN
jgi:putative endonuclease